MAFNTNSTGTAAGLVGTVPLDQGGTGEITQQAAINALTGSQSSGTFLRSNGTNSSLTTIQAGDVTAISGSLASPNVITDVGGISILAGKQKQVIFIKSSGGPVLITATPNIQAGTVVGQELLVCGTSNSDDVGILSGNGVICNGPLDFKSNTNCSFLWDGSVWVQTASFGL